MPKQKSRPSIKYEQVEAPEEIESIFDYIFSLIIEDESV
jgi:hypothetical protein